MNVKKNKTGQGMPLVEVEVHEKTRTLSDQNFS